ncbi:MAG: bifunctional DNA-formamidopyrimidine glycosylase/DNA-(apurinic or apyrimidinic site) lyase [Candidatus Buchananbacteria bacterium]
MPELPEVETLRRELVKAIKGKTIKSAVCNWLKMVRPLTVLEFQTKIKNKKIIGVNRKSKVLILDLAGPLALLIHLKLTGQLIFRDQTACLPAGRSEIRKKTLVVGGHPQKGGLDNLPNKFTHLILNFTDGSKLFFNDLRKFGWARLVNDLGVAEMIEKHGPEPLTKEFSFLYFQTILKKYPNRKIKQILLDQALISGLGNIYVDESCFCAKVLPMRTAKSLKPEEIKKLFSCIPEILKFAIAKKGTSADTYVQLNGQPGGMVPYLKVYGRKGQKCKRCGGVVEKIKLNGRGTHFCRSCQK